MAQPKLSGRLTTLGDRGDKSTAASSVRIGNVQESAAAELAARICTIGCDDEKKCLYMTECHLSTLAGLKFTQSVELAFAVGQIDWTTELHTIIYSIREYGWIFTTGWHPLRYMQMQHKN